MGSTLKNHIPMIFQSNNHNIKVRKLNEEIGQFYSSPKKDFNIRLINSVKN